jgi:signal transduction histidine kinase
MHHQQSCDLNASAPMMNMLRSLLPKIEPFSELRSHNTARIKRFVWMFLLAIVWMLAVMMYESYGEYQASYYRGKEETVRLTAIVAEQMDQSLQTVDLTLQHAAERQYLNQLFGGKLPDDLVHNFTLWVDDIPQVTSLVMINAKGVAEIAVNKKEYANWIDYKAPFDDFLPFILLKEDESTNNVIMPYVSASNPNQRFALIARRMNKLDGSFGGIVLAAVKLEFFLDFFASVNTGNARYVDVVTETGESLFDGVSHHSRWTGDKALWHEIQKHRDKEKAFPYGTGDLRLLVSHRTLKHAPLTMMIAVDESEFMSDYWKNRFKDISILTIFAVFGVAVAYFIIAMVKQVVRVEESESAAILASQAKSEFLANMSHELRTPLNAIIGFSEMMTAGYFGPLSAKQKERIGDISVCGSHLLQLINDILEFSKGEAGRMELVEEKVSIPTIIDEAMRIMHEKVKTKGVHVSIDARDTLPLLFADKRKVKQVLINLISNAVKFTPPEGEITITAHQDGAGNMLIAVRDTGIGIAEDDIATALAVFGQVHRSQSHEGTGLGLPLCRMFTELHGGKLALTSTLGEGTTVKLMFPAARIVQPEEDAMAVG